MRKPSLIEAVQLELPKTRGRGGRRKGAGRKPRGNRHPHTPRPLHKERFPLHVTLRVRRKVPSLRERAFGRMKWAFSRGCDKFGMRLCHFSVQGNHIHLIVEAADKESLSRGMHALEIRIARAINRVFGRRGPVFADRYHAHELRTPTEVKNAVHYVLFNMQKHARERGIELHPWDFDPFSTWDGAAQWLDDEHRTIAAPRTWLLRNATSVPIVYDAKRWR